MPAQTTNVDTLLLQLKRDVLASITEYLGTTVFLLIGLGGIQAAAMSTEAAKDASKNNNVSEVASVEQLFYISTSMALALLASAWTFFRISGSVFNPNVAIALALTGALKPVRFFLYVIAEILGAMTASAILSAILPGTLSVSCGLGLGTKVWQGLIIEAILTGFLTFTVLFLAVEKHRVTPFAPVAIGLVLFATHMFGVVFTGAAMNSARAFGPDVITGFKSYHWIYWLGPSLGSIGAATLYLFLKSVDYESLNPKQDSDNAEDSPDLQGIEVKMRRRNTHMEKSLGSNYASGMSQHPMPSNFGLVTGAYPNSIYQTNMTEAGGLSSPTHYDFNGRQSTVPPGRPYPVNGAPSIVGGTSVHGAGRIAPTNGYSPTEVLDENAQELNQIEAVLSHTDRINHEKRMGNS